MQGLTIRPARAEDYEQMEAIMEEVHALHVGWRPDVYCAASPVLEREEFEALRAAGLAVAAECAGKVSGLCLYRVRHVETPVQVKRRVLFISSLAVLSSCRGQGIGRALMEDARRRAKDFDGLELQVNACNRAALAFYESCGFTEKSINMELL